MGKVLPHDRLADEFADLVHFLVIYVREPHPGEHYEMHTTYEQKCGYARDVVRLEGLRRRVLVDELDGAVHRAYGAWPNMALVIDAQGGIVLRQRWGDPNIIRATLRDLLADKPVEPWTSHEFRIRGPLLRVMFRAGRTATVDFFFKGGFPLLYALARIWESVRPRPRTQ